MEVRKLINSKLVEYQCDECGDGKMLPTGNIFTSYPPLYEHKCNNCGFITNFRVQYPHVEYFDSEAEQ